MNSGLLNYQLQNFTGHVSHGWSKPGFVRDVQDQQQATSSPALDAQVRSGDYFITLATILDQLGRNADDYYTQAALEDAVSDLIYLQDHYVITKNKQPE